MAMFRNVGGAAVAVLVVMAMVLEAQAVCPEATSMLSCQGAVTKPDVEPSIACCNKVKEVLETDGPQCLCTVMTSPTAKAFKVLTQEAIKLPSKCHKLIGLTYAPGFVCDGQNVP